MSFGIRDPDLPGAVFLNGDGENTKRILEPLRSTVLRGEGANERGTAGAGFVNSFGSSTCVVGFMLGGAKGRSEKGSLMLLVVGGFHACRKMSCQRDCVVIRNGILARH